MPADLRGTPYDETRRCDVEITSCSDWTAMRSRYVVPAFTRLVAPTALRVEGGVRPQAAFDATAKGPQSWSPPIT